MATDETQNYLVFGGIAVAALLIVAVYGRSTKTDYAVDPNAAAAESAIVAANSNAINAGVNEHVALATIAAQTVQAHDANTTALAIAANNGATQVQLATIAANATVAATNLQSQAEQAIATTDANVQRDISNNDATAAQRSASASKWGSVTNAISSIAKMFSFNLAPPNPYGVTDPNGAVSAVANDTPPVWTPPNSVFAPVSFVQPNVLSGQNYTG